MEEVINGYKLLEPFQNKNAGFCRWTYGEKNNKVYFLKEFLDPVYPMEETLTIELRNHMIEGCKLYQDSKVNLYEAINNASDGNLIRIAEFFRCDSHYYVATEKVTNAADTEEELRELPFDSKLLLCKTIAHSMMRLHEAHIVHADIKESNIIIKKTSTGAFVGKIIDHDSSFSENDPPKYEDELCGDQVYLAPEACQFICGEKVELSCKLDVFALGLLFHKYLTGDLPSFDKKEYDYAFEAVLDDKKLGIADNLPGTVATMLDGMLQCDPADRFSMEKVYQILDRLYPENQEQDRDTGEGAKEEKANKEVSTTEGGNRWFHAAGDL